MEFNSLILEAAEKFKDIYKVRWKWLYGYELFYRGWFKEKQKKNIGTLSFEDWKNVRSMWSYFNHVKIFYMVTLKFFYFLYVISNSFSNEFIYMHTNISQMCRNKDNLSCRMRKNMMLKYEKY
jgi:hypothetical protein